MSSPGAAMPTHGPAIVNDDGVPSGASDPTDSTYCCHHAGIATAVTPDQFRGSDGSAGSDSGLESQPPAAPPSPAAATITTSLSTAAYRSAAPRPLWSKFSPTGTHVTAEMLMTRAPRSAARTIAPAIASVSSIARVTAGSSPASRGAYRGEDTRIDRMRAAGATPEKPSAPGCPAISP